MQPSGSDFTHLQFQSRSQASILGTCSHHFVWQLMACFAGFTEVHAQEALLSRLEYPLYASLLCMKYDCNLLLRSPDR